MSFDPELRARQFQTLPVETLKGLYLRSDAQGALRIGFHLLAIALGSAIVWATSGTVWMVPAMLLQGLFLVSLFAPMHECVHQTAFASRWANDLCAFLAGGALLYVASYYRQFHVLHHRHTQDPAHDPELLQAPYPRHRAEFWLRVSALPFWLLRLSQLAGFAIGRFDGLAFLGRKGHAEIIRSTWLLLALLAAAVALSLWLGSAAIIWYWLLPLLLAMPFLRLYLMCEHGGCAQSADAFVNTRTTHTIWPVRLLMWNMPFHAEHHLYPNIPFHALPSAHERLQAHMKIVSEGYLATLRQLYAAYSARPA